MYMDRPPARKKKTKPKPTDRASLQPRTKVSKRTVKKMAAEGPKKRMRRQGEPPNKTKKVGPRMDRRMKVAAAKRKKGMGR
tara:strand:+ start:165 stop:407 length:243 start_codon:yes stop_codon:yes gene_type:complete